MDESVVDKREGDILRVLEDFNQAKSVELKKGNLVCTSEGFDDGLNSDD